MIPIPAKNRITKSLVSVHKRSVTKFNADILNLICSVSVLLSIALAAAGPDACAVQERRPRLRRRDPPRPHRRPRGGVRVQTGLLRRHRLPRSVFAPGEGNVAGVSNLPLSLSTAKVPIRRMMHHMAEEHEREDFVHANASTYRCETFIFQHSCILRVTIRIVLGSLAELKASKY